MATKAAARVEKATRKAKATGRAGIIIEVDELVEPLIKKEWGVPPPSWAEILLKYKVRYADIFIYREKYIHRYHIKLPILSDEELLLVKEALLRYLIEPKAVLEDLLRETGLPEQLVLRVRDEVLGLGVFEVLMDDPYIEDIQVIHAESPLKIIHSNFGATLSNIVLGEEYVNRIVRTALKTANIALTKIKPYRSFMGPRGYRFSVMMKSDVAPLTTSFVIRKPIRIWTLSAMTKYGSIPVIMAGFLWLAFQERLAILLTGGMMTGKTSLSNAILSSIPPTATAVIIEDTPELTPPIKALRRVPRQEKGVEITPFDLVVHALRESADYVIVGEVRGPEAAAWAQAILLGHGGLCLPEDQLVLMMVDGVIDLYKIGEVVKGVLENKYKDVRVIALDDGGRPKWTRISRVIVKNGTKRFIRITSVGGVVHEVHENHPVIVYENGRLLEKKAKELKAGDILVSIRSIPPLSLGQKLTSITVPEVLREYIDKLYVYGLSEVLSNANASTISRVAMVSYYVAYEWLKNTAIPLTRALKLLEKNIINKGDLEKAIVLYGAKARWGIPYKIRLSRDFGYIIGLFLADGSMSFGSRDKIPRRVIFYIENNMDKIRRIIKSLESIGIERGAIRIRKTKSEKAIALTVESKIFALLLYELLRGKVKDKDRSIPLDIALRAPPMFRVGLIHGFWDGDGTIHKDRRGRYKIVAETINRKLAESIVVVLKSLGINASITLSNNNRGLSKNSSTIFVIRISGGESKQKFLRLMGIKENIRTYSKTRRNGDLLLLSVKKIEIVEKDSLLYDIEVPGSHVYALSGGLILTHNTTFHAETPESGFRRLLMPPLEVSPAALDAIYIIVHLRRLLVKGKMRRVAELYSHEGGGKLIPVIQFNPARGIHELVTPLHTIRPVKVISEKRGWTPSEVLEEIRVRAKIVKDLEKFEGSVEEYNKKLYETLYERRGTVLM